MAKPSIVVEGVSKKFGLSLKAALKYGLIDSARRLAGRGSDQSLRSGEFWSLNDINFTLESGDSLGIMGVNGSGKTTLLRILNGTYNPDKGKVMLRGRIGALIAAGAGFSPMLSGRENIYINGALLGMTPAEIRKKFDEIVAFAELGDFIDMPVRNYSSGMNVRLGFAIAVIGTPEILLVDEVLAVGDLNFQKKCFERIQQLKRAGTTILLVSHSPGSIWSVCNKGLVINKGKSEGIVPVEDACKAYDYYNMLARNKERKNQGSSEELSTDYSGTRGGTGDVVISAVDVLDEHGSKVSEVEYGKSFTLRHYVDVRNPIEDVTLRIQLDAEINKAIAIIDSYELHNQLYKFDTGSYVFDVEVKNPNLRPGVYDFCPSVVCRSVGIHLFYQYGMASLIVKQTANAFFYADFRASVHLNSTYKIHPMKPGES